jgi:hypothetical protein
MIITEMPVWIQFTDSFADNLVRIICWNNDC